MGVGAVPAEGDDPEEIYGKHAAELVRFATGLVGPTEAPDAPASSMRTTTERRRCRSIPTYCPAIGASLHV
jgi:hypothetical protein